MNRIVESALSYMDEPTLRGASALLEMDMPLNLVTTGNEGVGGVGIVPRNMNEPGVAGQFNAILARFGTVTPLSIRDRMEILKAIDQRLASGAGVDEDNEDDDDDPDEY